MTDLQTVALFQYVPRLRGLVPWRTLGDWPTPVDTIDVGEGVDRRQIWIKREDLSSPVYGGNKVRTLEAHSGLALAQAKGRIWSTGAYGSNHATATLLHAPRCGLEAGAMLFAQPSTQTAKQNLLAMASTDENIVALRTPLSLPWSILRRRWSGDYVMTPGGANPVGALGHVSAGLELAAQVEAGVLPAPRAIYLAVGSTCTSAGLLLGLHLAARLGVGFGAGRAKVPLLRPVRVTPWPITSTAAVVWLARRTARRLHDLLGEPARVDLKALAASVDVIGGQIGRGYGYPTATGATMTKEFTERDGPTLDPVYSAKAAAGMRANWSGIDGPVLYWATKSSAPLPSATAEQARALPRRMRRWLSKPDEQTPR